MAKNAIRVGVPPRTRRHLGDPGRSRLGLLGLSMVSDLVVAYATGRIEVVCLKLDRILEYLNNVGVLMLRVWLWTIRHPSMT